MGTQYVGSTKYTAVAQWAANHVYAQGSIVRQLAAPAVGSERCFRTANGGTSGSAEPTWVLTAGSTSPTDGTITDWVEVTGNATYGWAAAHARLGNCVSNNGTAGWAGANDIIYVSNNHAETSTSVTNLLFINANPYSPQTVLCVNDSAFPPTTLATTATITTTTNGAMVLNGYVYFYGISFSVGTGTSAALFNIANNVSNLVFDTCNLTLGTTGGSSNISIGASPGNAVVLVNTPIHFNDVGQIIKLSAELYIRDTVNPFTGTAPTLIFNTFASGPALLDIRNCDLSTMTSELVHGSLGTNWRLILENCKLPASPNINSQTIVSPAGFRYDLINCDNGAVNYHNETGRFQGSVKTDINCVRTSGATDGTTPISWKMTTNSSSMFLYPLVSPDILVWNDTAGASKTVSLAIVHDINGNSALTDAECWLEVESLNSSSSPKGTFQTERNSGLLAIMQGGAGTTLATDSTSTWSGSDFTALTTPSKQTLSFTFTPNMKGLLRIRVALVRPSKVIFVDPLVTVI